MPVPLSLHFSLEELTWSDTAQRLGLDNTPSETIIANLRDLAQLLEAVRAALGYPLHITSGYRCDRLNTIIGGSRSSRHMLGLAADFVCPGFGRPAKAARAIVRSPLAFDQLIYEHTWLHLGLPVPGDAPRRQVLTLHPPREYVRGILEREA